MEQPPKSSTIEKEVVASLGDLWFSVQTLVPRPSEPEISVCARIDFPDRTDLQGKFFKYKFNPFQEGKGVFRKILVFLQVFYHENVQ